MREWAGYMPALRSTRLRAAEAGAGAGVVHAVDAAGEHEAGADGITPGRGERNEAVGTRRGIVVAVVVAQQEAAQGERNVAGLVALAQLEGGVPHDRVTDGRRVGEHRGPVAHVIGSSAGRRQHRVQGVLHARVVRRETTHLGDLGGVAQVRHHVRADVTDRTGGGVDLVIQRLAAQRRSGGEVRRKRRELLPELLGGAELAADQGAAGAVRWCRSSRCGIRR
ncbi:hypothetical protein G6F60_013806 [Rhizopus arrhizus]|nr:hypothetical protein G6F60_013806 [Rhizopus arrhizus]